MKVALRVGVTLIALSVITVGSVVYSVSSRGLSTRVPPTAVEERLARAMRWLATPSSVRDRANPVEPTAAGLDEALAHFADHCAACHGNDGSGDTPMGRSFYPPTPDMRAGKSQNLTDGELFSIIENGIRLSGMPAWGNGTPDSERASWGLVHFIRRLPALTPEELARMEALNPRSPEEFRAQEAARRFLAGETAPAAAPAATGDGAHD
jgi:mono/diheme cytochrome c family protein